MKRGVYESLVGIFIGLTAIVLWNLVEIRQTQDRRAVLEAEVSRLLETRAKFDTFVDEFDPWVVDDASPEDHIWYFRYEEDGIYRLTLGIDTETNEIISSSRGPFRSLR